MNSDFLVTELARLSIEERLREARNSSRRRSFLRTVRRGPARGWRP